MNFIKKTIIAEEFFENLQMAIKVYISSSAILIFLFQFTNDFPQLFKHSTRVKIIEII
jgi:hypothetical protein